MGEARAVATDAPRPRRRRRRLGLRALPLRLLAIGSLAVVVAAVVWMVQETRLQRPTVAKVASLGDRLPRKAAPKPMDDAPGLLDLGVDTLAFPDWSRFGWRPVGARSDQLAGREAVTVSYANRGRRLTYTIVSGTGHIGHPAPTRTTYRREPGGATVELDFLANARGGLTLTFKRRARTVVMTTPAEAAASWSTMVRLAAWAANGRLSF